ncbi:peptidoglycan bridge formation glycyltransferase FemA/FemB family protein [Candidatus Mcinerneyibacteriota bacterium]|nr:peptidoglycan bridge formation glycyltransferase FemA/FemB family protein [Candidatus Mcinerneyibacteriota bacterium]
MPKSKLSVRRLTPEDYKKAGDGIPHHFLQSAEWGLFKSRHGWEPQYWGLYREKSCAGLALVLRRSLPRGYVFAYIPKGPTFAGGEEEFSEAAGLLAEAVRAHAGKKLLFIRMEPHLLRTEPLERTFRRKGWVPAPYDVQYRFTRRIRITDLESLWASFTSKQRNKIRTAERKGVEIKRLSDKKELKAWYEIYCETARRNRIFIHPFSYYEDFFESFHSAGFLSFWAAFFNDHMMAGAFIIHYPGESIYMYSGSSDFERQRRPNEAIQWAALREAAERGAQEYDLWGVAPPGEKSHPWNGLSEFKSGFGGRVQEFAGCWDLPVRRGLYRLFLFAEKMRRFALLMKKKRGGAG